MNLFEKIHAIMVSDEVNIWHFQHASPKPQFVFWAKDDPNVDGYKFDTCEEMIDECYKRIDPLLKPLPKSFCPPEQAKDRMPPWNPEASNTPNPDAGTGVTRFS